MIDLKVKNSFGEVLVLSDYPELVIDNIDGLNPPDSTIVTNKFQRIGTVFSSSAIDERHIVLKILILGNVSQMVDLLDSFFFTGDNVELIFDDYWHIDGYVEKSERNRFSNSVFQLVSITCPYPYFRSPEQTATLTRDTPVTINSAFNGIFSPEITISVSDYTNIVIFENGEKRFQILKVMDEGDEVVLDLDKKHCTLNGANIFDACSGDWDTLKIKRGVNTVSTPTPNIVATIRWYDHKAGL